MCRVVLSGKTGFNLTKNSNVRIEDPRINAIKFTIRRERNEPPHEKTNNMVTAKLIFGFVFVYANC